MLTATEGERGVLSATEVINATGLREKFLDLMERYRLLEEASGMTVVLNDPLPKYKVIKAPTGVVSFVESTPMERPR